MCHYIGGACGFSRNFLHEFLGESHIHYLACMVLEDFGVGVVRKVEDKEKRMISIYYVGCAFLFDNREGTVIW